MALPVPERIRAELIALLGGTADLYALSNLDLYARYLNGTLIDEARLLAGPFPNLQTTVPV